MELSVAYESITCIQASTALDAVREQLATLQAVVDEADDGVFEDFCRKIRVKNIREYEERQLKALQEGSEARTRFNANIQKLTHM